MDRDNGSQGSVPDAGGISADELLERWSYLPSVDPAKLRSDADGVLDAIRERGRIELSESPADIIRRARDTGGRED